MAKYECDKCGYIYDDKMGDIKAGIMPGTDPDDIHCPSCRLPGWCFNLIEKDKEPPVPYNVEAMENTAKEFDSYAETWKEAFVPMPIIPYNLFKTLKVYKEFMEQYGHHFSWESIIRDIKFVFCKVNSQKNPKSVDFDGIYKSIMETHIEFAKYDKEYIDTVDDFSSFKDNNKHVLEMYTQNAMGFFFRLFDGEAECKVSPEYGRALNCEREAVVRAWNDYFHNIYYFCCFPYYYRESCKILNNQEFNKIVMQIYGVEGQADLDKLFDIYMTYYSDLYTKNVSKSDWFAYVSLSVYSNRLPDYIPSAKKEYLSATHDNLDEILDKIFANTNSGKETVDYLLKLVLEENFFDHCIRDDGFDYQFENLQYCLFDRIREKYTLSELVISYAHKYECDLNGKVKTYRDKYILLNPLVETVTVVISENLLAAYSNLSTGEDFEKLLKVMYEEMGYKVEMTPTTGDQGADLIVEKRGIKTAIQAKYYSSPVSNSAVQEVVASMALYKADKGMVITNSTFTNSARELAMANHIKLMDGGTLEVLLEALTI